MFNKPFRNHFSYTIENAFRALWVIIIFVIVGFAQNTNAIEKFELEKIGLLLPILAILAIFLLVYIIMVLRWSKTFISIANDAIIIEANLIIKKKTTIGISNISTINLQQNIFERIIGTSKVKIDTNSRSTAETTDLNIILKTDKAIQFKEYILNELKGNNEESIEESTEDTKFDIVYPFSDVIKHTILSINAYQIVSIIIAIALTINWFINDEFKSIISDNLFQSIVLIILLIGPSLLAYVKTFFKLYGFKLRKINDKIEINYGLLTKKKYMIPIDKISAMKIKQPLFARIINKYCIEIINIGIGDTENESSTLLLIDTKENIIKKLALIAPQVNLEFNYISQPKSALIPIMINTLILAILAIITICISTQYYLLIIILPLIFVLSLLSYVTKKILLTENNIFITNGIFEKSTSRIDYGKIQHIEIKTNFLTKHFNIGKAHINLLATVANSTIVTGYFNLKEYDKIILKTNEKN